MEATSPHVYNKTFLSVRLFYVKLGNSIVILPIRFTVSFVLVCRFLDACNSALTSLRLALLILILISALYLQAIGYAACFPVNCISFSSNIIFCLGVVVSSLSDRTSLHCLLLI